MKLTRQFRKFSQSAYTVIEVLAAASVIAVGMTAAVSLSSSLMLQEEMAWRVAVTRNYQENMARLWQLGLSPADVSAVMPTQTASPLLNQMISGIPVVVEQPATENPSSLGKMQAAAITADVNISQDPLNKIQGSRLTLSVYRPSIISSLRPPAPK
jgi:hypothetical protein